jgi:hypothetical protein
MIVPQQQQELRGGERERGRERDGLMMRHERRERWAAAWQGKRKQQQQADTLLCSAK